jgi:catechol 2,3-dioxygenase-like lactoylglutathione lyase family enzyme
MRVRGIRWLGTPTDRYAETVAFARDILGLSLRHEQEDFAVFEAENGDTFEVFGPKGIADGHEFMVAPVAGFEVDDVVAARAEMEAKGIQFIGEIHDADSSAWSHFYGPDGHVYEITARK